MTTSQAFPLGLVFGALITGVIFTGRYAHKIRTFKMRLLHRNKKMYNENNKILLIKIHKKLKIGVDY